MKSSNPKNNNPKGNPEFLTPYKAKWRSGKTRTIRVPIAIADEVLAAAKLIDEDKSLSTNKGSQNGSKELEEAIEILSNALALKTNAGGAIKKEIRKALELLSAGY